MELKGTRTIAADRQTVWAALNDPEVLKACIPGCSELTGSPEDGFAAVVTQKVGPVKATFKGAVSLSEIDAPNSYVISGEGKGGAAGFAKGSAKVALSDVADGTELAYDVDAKVGGKLAQLGSRLIDGFAKKMADQFFENFQTQIEGPAEVEDAPEAESDEAAEGDTPKKGWVKKLIG
ncbi:CoxG family protein [Oceanomicrobium pacificus]|uniref:Carbon monoxide dehydrogenase n=1 Tax=Oceanomicrobium pacificus TaxID=2692916 RepID=A0A6B0TNC4_9RHOB|nr:carbon monoxide dehydrogenase subunit G [Oceanomicrobium pacificus]MXU66100.1 carbon monoxide dehydrogenase [Oceanomicrobium pacificus]